MASYQRFTYQEAFRNLYTSLRFLNSDSPVKSVAVSSSVPSEGKSLLIVLLVDADLRQPQMHHRLGLNNLNGLSNLLTEEGSDWRSLLQSVPEYSGWQVLTAGRRVPDPPRLLSSERMGQLVQDIAASGAYDLILYDTPPAMGLADASLLAESLDSLVTNARIATGDRTSIDGYAKYGYGSYTDGASALDPSTAYNYYTTGEREDRVKPQGIKAFLPTKANAKWARKGVKDWLS